MVCQPATMRDREIEAHHGVHGNDQRRRQPGQQQRRRLIPRPVHGRTAPAHRQHSVNDLRGAVLRAVAQRRQVRNQSHEPEQQRNRGVRRNRENVPHQRAAELRPQPHRIRIRHQPVEEPRPAHVQQGKHAGARHGKKRHRFGEPVDGSAPLLPQQQQNGGNQRAGVTNSDPPDEIDDRKAPADRDIDAPDAHALHQQVRHAIKFSSINRAERDGEAENPARGRAASQHNRADLVRYRSKRMPRLNNRMSRS